MTTGPFAELRGQLRDAAEAFAGTPDAVAEILTGIVDDVDRALREELEIFPVCHHSPSSGLAMARRLREKQPEVIYLELCEDLTPLLTELRNCRLPVALQAFASNLDGFPKSAGPLSLIAPISEASAEYQAIAYALDTPGVELVLVDRSSDHAFQWHDRDTDAPAPAGETTDEEAALHGNAVGVEIGDLRPRFAELEEHLLHHGQVRHWSEWWDQYVEQPLAGADYDTYRQVMALIGSLFRRLTPPDSPRLTMDEDRERYMWTRIRQHLAASGTDHRRCLYVCGSFHASSRVAEFGIAGTDTFTIPERTGTEWLYGLIPSSHSAIEAQFGLAQGSVSIAVATWQKELRRAKVKPFRLEGQPGGKSAGKRKAKKAAVAPATPAVTTTDVETVDDRLSGFLAAPPAVVDLDEAELLGWCVDIVRLARKNGYLSSTADAIAIFETAILLAGMRNRARPTPYDFADAAVTCIEKDAVPGRRDVRRLCEILLGGDRIGQVGYESLPPLARDVADRLAPLKIDLTSRKVQRVLIDLKAEPHLRAGSKLLWMLRYLLPPGSVRAIMGSNELGHQSIQESWDVSIGREQRYIIELGYEGVTVEQVLETRLRREAWGPDATAVTALRAVEDSILYLENRRLTEDLGQRAIELLAAERTVDQAPEVLRRIRRLMGYYRTAEPELPDWCTAFVSTGYHHYCTLLPTAFTDDDAGVDQVAAMLGFLFTLENVALAVGCDRAQLELAVAQSHPEAPAKVALRWAAQFQLGVLPLPQLRQRCDELLTNPLVLPAFPKYLGGFTQALDPAPGLTSFVVELISKAFGSLPDRVLLPWLPTLITTLRAQAGDQLVNLLREAGRTFPGSLPQLDTWVPPWSGAAEPAAPRRSRTRTGPVGVFLAEHPATCDTVAAAWGCEPTWSAVAAGSDSGPDSGPVAELLTAHPEVTAAVAAGIGAV